jgi:NADH-quinone oxidoreductase subunit M
MEFLNQWALPILVVWPLLSAVLVFASSSERLIKWGSVAASLLPLGISIYMVASFPYKSQGMGFEVQWPWIPAINSSIHLGADNLSIPLIFLTALLTTLSLYYTGVTI